LAVPGIRRALARRRRRAAAVSPLVGGRAVRGPLHRMLHGLGLEASPVGIARLYRGLVGLLVLDHVDPAWAPRLEALGVRAVAAGTEGGKDARAVEVILREAKRIVRMDRGHLICETRHGWVCANAGVDESNGVAAGVLTLLPRDADASAAALCERLRQRFGVELAVVVTDTFGRPWREGLVEVALGCAGMDPLLDLRGRADLAGRTLHHTVVALAD